ncbi:MAG: Asp-tRNA(Asn)/Glu-tRNA(Gln) amidotransferase subunit GatC [Mycolicibacterium sp.]|uniref:Asp-tRNA(Asn)/Glu-tRNA(Gln) amidotransferase subunit GatC n=1 Tax=Mycolicibacterium sp. TaxID=2320850 RepID=UPI003D135993
MSQISRDDIAHLARLSRLALTDRELDAFAGQLDAILDHVSRIQAVDVAGVEATDSPLTRRAGATRPGEISGVVNVFRPDEVRRSLTRDEALAAAPKSADDRFAVPRILGEPE